MNERRSWRDPARIVGYLVVAILVGVLTVQYVRALPQSTRDDRTAACRALDSAPFNPAIGRVPVAAPPFSAQDYTGQTVDLSAYRGKVVFLNFWQTACRPCVDEMPTMERLQQLVHSNDFVILALASETGWEPIRNFFPKGTAMTVLLDPPESGQAVGRISRRYGTERWPETYLIDKQGDVRFYYINRRDWDTPKAVECLKALVTE